MLLQIAADVPFLRAVIDYAVQHPEQTVPFVAAIAATVGNYARTGNVPIGRLPYRHIRRLLRDFGDTYFGKPRPKGVPAIVVEAPPDVVEDGARSENYESGDLYSYEYAGEDWNLRRPHGEARNPETGRMTPMEVHARGFRTENDKTLVLTHYEANRFEATTEHLDEGVFSWTEGRDIFADDLAATDLSYRKIESEAAADVAVAGG